jgi:epoxyqueuosine reductase
VPEALRPRLGRWLFGCDDCQLVCPHTRPPRADHPDLRPTNAWVPLPALLDADDDTLAERFAGTPLRRAAGARLRRNAAYVLGNVGDPAARPALERAARRGGVEGEAADWALGRLG